MLKKPMFSFLFMQSILKFAINSLRPEQLMPVQTIFIFLLFLAVRIFTFPCGSFREGLRKTSFSESKPHVVRLSVLGQRREISPSVRLDSLTASDKPSAHHRPQGTLENACSTQQRSVLPRQKTLFPKRFHRAKAALRICG